MSRQKYFAMRVVQTVFLLWLVLTFLFVLFRMLPGDPATLFLFGGADPETVEAFREKWGFNDPIWVQYLRYMENLVFHLDAGTSVYHREPVIDAIQQPLRNTVVLFVPSVITGYALGSIYGMVVGSNRGSLLDRYGIIPIVLVGAFPAFFTAMLLVIIFSGILDIFPASGVVSTETYAKFSDTNPWRMYFTEDFLMHAALPFTAIVLRYLYLPSLITRTSVVEVSDQAFHFYHRITGKSRLLRMKHLAKHASLPVITIFPISMARAIGGLVLIEIVFNWNGMGFFLVQSVFGRDFPVIQFVFFLIAAFVIISNFAVDIVYGIIDPRVAVEGESEGA
jgi:peptide/nickel transport system permease protein